MSKLYVFGIGGTGSRVLKSLIMLIASGVEIKADKVVPVVIDPDFAAGDLTRTVDLLRNYNKVRECCKFASNTENQFFGTPLDLSILPSVNLPISNTMNQKFSEFIGLNNMIEDGRESANYALASMLFSDSNLDMDMEVGFQGNPNIGSVVLNQITSSQEFMNIAGSFQQGDRIFVISSIFGGTGASGFPLLVKNLRNISGNVSGNGYVKSAPIGALTVLPYFSLEDLDEKAIQIDSSSFVSKARAALSYYDRNLNEVNVLYYIADTISKKYNNVIGGVTQKNDAHIVELAAAMSIIDFMSIDDNELLVVDGHPSQPIYKEFGIENESDSVIFKDLYIKDQKILMKGMTQFVYFVKYMQDQLENSMKQPWAIDLGFDENFLTSDFYSTLTKVSNHLLSWYREMGNNVRGFAPYNLDVTPKELFSMVKGIKPRKILTELNSNYALFDSVLNRNAKHISMELSIEERFIELFYKATRELTEKKLNIK